MHSNAIGLVKVDVESFDYIFNTLQQVISQHKQTYKTVRQNFMNDNPGKFVRCFPNLFKKKYVLAEYILEEDVDFHFGLWNDVPSKLIGLGYVKKEDILFCGEFFYKYPKIVDDVKDLKKLVQNSTDGYVYLGSHYLSVIKNIKEYLK